LKVIPLVAEISARFSRLPMVRREGQVAQEKVGWMTEEEMPAWLVLRATREGKRPSS
jgi:hypothetical protein